MMGWNYYPKSSPRMVENGIKAKSRRGDIGEQWWAKRFIESLHRMGMDSRLARGRTYARKGQVTSFSMKDGVVSASVQGSMPRPYSVEIRLKRWDENQWKRVIAEIAGQALYSAELLAGEMPHEIENIIEKTRVHLFPESKQDLMTDCSCPDFANPCKHIAAVYYLLAEQFDEDPFLIFAMRGKEKDQLLQEIRAERGSEDTEPAQKPASADITGVLGPQPPSLSGFYSLKVPLDDFTVRLTARPEVKGALLRRLGPSPLMIGKKNLSDLIAPIYDYGHEQIWMIMHGEDSDPPEDS